MKFQIQIKEEGILENLLGLNPYIEKPIGDTLFDEKIKGSFHFTPGDSLEESNNGKCSSIHWDIVNNSTDNVDNQMCFLYYYKFYIN